MTDMVSNCPVSRPANTGHKADFDIGGMMWSDDHGMFYAITDEMLPIRPPTPRDR